MVLLASEGLRLLENTFGNFVLFWGQSTEAENPGGASRHLLSYNFGGGQDALQVPDGCQIVMTVP